MSLQHMVKILYDYMSSVSEGVNTSLFLSEDISSNLIRNTILRDGGVGTSAGS